MRKNSIEYFLDCKKNKYFIYFYSEKGLSAGDIELCDFIGIKQEMFNNITNRYQIYIDKPYNDNYAITYFDNENEIKEFIEILESYLIGKLLYKE